MKVIHNTEIEQITFLDERYYLDEKTQTYYPSVTTILDVWPKGYGYIQWLKDLGSNADEVMKRAGDQGSKIHDAIFRYLNGDELIWSEVATGKDNFSLDEWMMILKFVEFYTTYKPEVLATEETLVSGKLGYGGTLDLVCRLNGEVWYIDYKSGNAIYKTHKIQGVAYQKLWNEQRKDKITRMACMHLRAFTRGPDKSGKTIQGEGWKLEETEEPEKMFNLFLHAQEIWKEENPNAKPKNMVYPDRISLERTKKQEEANK
jgi:hypothetical protein